MGASRSYGECDKQIDVNFFFFILLATTNRRHADDRPVETMYRIVLFYFFN